MKTVSFITMCVCLSSCSGIGSFFQDPISISQNQAIEISVDKDAITKGTNLTISIDVENTQPPK